MREGNEIGKQPDAGNDKNRFPLSCSASKSFVDFTRDVHNACI